MVAPLALVLGDLDLIRPLGRAGIRCAAVVAQGDPARFSRFVRAVLEPLDHWTEQAAFVERLVDWAQRQPERPVLFYQTDGDLLMVSRHREALAQAFRLVLPDPDLVEDLVDKARFARLAERLDLPVPRSRLVRGDDVTSVVDLRFPLVVKPLTRQALAQLQLDAKAVQVGNEAQLRRLQQRLEGSGLDLLAQELVPGAESRIESYHAYVDCTGAVAGEFTGRKIHTYPGEFGHSTVVEITRVHDVAEIGRDVLARLGLRGVAKVDVKRDPAGRLHLLEVNPRFNLWHAAGAVAGVNLPATVYADLTGSRRPPLRPLQAGVRWFCPQRDHWAVRAGERRRAEWLATLLSSSVRSGLDWDDPGPWLLGMLWPRLHRRWPWRRAHPSAREV